MFTRSFPTLWPQRVLSGCCGRSASICGVTPCFAGSRHLCRSGLSQTTGRSLSLRPWLHFVAGNGEQSGARLRPPAQQAPPHTGACESTTHPGSRWCSLLPQAGNRTRRQSSVWDMRSHLWFPRPPGKTISAFIVIVLYR